jgi:ankyrin repeat protein
MLCYRSAIKEFASHGAEEMRAFVWFAACAVAIAAPAQALQMSDIETFIDAVKKRDGGKATEILNARGSTVVNGRNARGETALLAAVGERNPQFTLFLLQNGADPNIAARDGETPLILAARMGFTEAVEWLLASGAKVDAENRLGETPLIVAVQRRHAPIVKLLLELGADPDKADAAAGYSARDYAKRDARARDILSLIEGTKRKSDKLEDFSL